MKQLNSKILKWVQDVRINFIQKLKILHVTIVILNNIYKFAIEIYHC